MRSLATLPRLASCRGQFACFLHVEPPVVPRDRRFGSRVTFNVGLGERESARVVRAHGWDEQMENKPRLGALAVSRRCPD